jgi:hypothetical protein
LTWSAWFVIVENGAKCIDIVQNQMKRYDMPSAETIKLNNPETNNGHDALDDLWTTVKPTVRGLHIINSVNAPTLVIAAVYVDEQDIAEDEVYQAHTTERHIIEDDADEMQERTDVNEFVYARAAKNAIRQWNTIESCHVIGDAEDEQLEIEEYLREYEGHCICETVDLRI